ncbi:MAG: YoaP domain-containing protein [Clostridiaceae bacterium]|nr:YoaP domain-containing protein [Clostridiaceae bacterium]
MKYIKITSESLEKEHICCAITSNSGCQVSSKKAWLKEQFKDGLVFLKADARGKCFVEYIPAENAWVPIEADGYMYINCLWVSGQFKGHGYSGELLNECIRDSREKGKIGICTISSDKKRPFLSDPSYLAHKHFLVADIAEPYFTLVYLPFDDKATAPKFKTHVKSPSSSGNGFELYYTHGCPFCTKYALLAEQAAKNAGVPFKSILINSRQEAQNAPAAWTNYALFFDGKFLTNEILSEKKICSLFEEVYNKGGLI